jgi:hypothetical protein
MKIIAKYKDYYDIGQRSFDDTILYVRVPERIMSSNDPSDYANFSDLIGHAFTYRDSTRGRLIEITIHTVTIIFCGKVYPSVEMSTYGVSDADGYHYSFDSLEAALAKFGLDFKTISRTSFPRNLNSIKEYFSNNQNVHSDLCAEYKSPIVTITNGRYNHVSVTKNDILSQYQFFKVLDPYSAFQELEMFLGGIMAPENKKMIEISDRYKIEEHGFDKWSFKKAPTKMKK